MVCRLEKKEEELFRAGPLAVLTTSVQSNSQVCYVVSVHDEDLLLSTKMSSSCDIVDFLISCLEPNEGGRRHLRIPKGSWHAENYPARDGVVCWLNSEYPIL